MIVIIRYYNDIIFDLDMTLFANFGLLNTKRGKFDPSGYVVFHDILINS